jgi:hypothetical protein
MNPFHQQTQWSQHPSDYPHCLPPAEKQDKTSDREVIREFFSYYDLDDAEENLWDLVLAAIGSDNLNEDNLTRHNLLNFYDRAKSLFKAVYELYRCEVVSC